MESNRDAGNGADEDLDPMTISPPAKSKPAGTRQGKVAKVSFTWMVFCLNGTVDSILASMMNENRIILIRTAGWLGHTRSFRRYARKDVLRVVGLSNT